MRLLPLLPALLFAACPAFAQQAAPPAPQRAAAAAQSTIIAEPVAMMIAAFDTDGDARVTRAEFDAGVAHSFDSIDTGHKGAIGYIAFAEWSERWLGDRNALPNPFEVDTDGDNRITLGELVARFDLFFARFDLNKDGVLTRSELLTLRNPVMMMGRGRGKDRSRGE